VCSSGTYSTAPTIPCATCSIGYYCPNSTVQIQCSSGNYCLSGSTSQTPCSAGYYCSTPSTQQACTANSYCPASTVTPVACTVCSAGYFVSTACNSTSNAVCTPCGLGYYSSTPNSGSCQQCNAIQGSATFTSTVATSATCPSACPAGSYGDGVVCTPCAAGTYALVGATTCASCTNAPSYAGFYTGSASSNSCPYSLQCQAGEYWDSADQGMVFFDNGRLRRMGFRNSSVSTLASFAQLFTFIDGYFATATTSTFYKSVCWNLESKLYIYDFGIVRYIDFVNRSIQTIAGQYPSPSSDVNGVGRNATFYVSNLISMLYDPYGNRLFFSSSSSMCPRRHAPPC
jgi:hypothetical protein